MHDDYFRRMLVLAARTDTREEIDWTLNVGEDAVTFVVPCSGVFDEDGDWDAVPVRPSDVDSFEKAVCEVEALTGGDATFGPLLYACRTRGRRPRNPSWPADSRVHFLFEACGPDRAIDEPERAVAEPAVAAEPAVLSAGAGWPALTLTVAEEILDWHRCASSPHSEPGHCGACGKPVVQS